ncbi:archease [Candidatus Undinarchaeota archaeon]
MWPFKKIKNPDLENRAKALEKRKNLIDKKKKDIEEKSSKSKKKPKTKTVKAAEKKIDHAKDKLEKGLETLEKLGDIDYVQPEGKPYAFRYGKGIVNVKVKAKTLDKLFNNTAEAMFSLMNDIESVELLETKSFDAEADYPADLLKDWLDSLLFSYGVDYLTFSKFNVKITGNKLTATAQGEDIDSAKHEIKGEVKNIAKDVEVIQTDSGFEASLSFEM